MAETQATISEWAASVGINAEPERVVTRAAEEMDEALDAVRSGDMQHTAVELADVVICLFVAAERMGVDLQAEIDAKMRINRGRTWRRDASGCVYHVKQS